MRWHPLPRPPWRNLRMRWSSYAARRVARRGSGQNVLIRQCELSHFILLWTTSATFSDVFIRVVWSGLKQMVCWPISKQSVKLILSSSHRCCSQDRPRTYQWNVMAINEKQIRNIAIETIKSPCPIEELWRRGWFPSYYLEKSHLRPAFGTHQTAVLKHILLD